MEQYRDSIWEYSPPAMPPSLREYNFASIIFLVVFFIIIPNAFLALLFLIKMLIKYKRYKKHAS